MRNWIKLYWDRCLSVAAILSSTVAIYSSFPLVKPIGIDYMGVLVGILSLLVTTLIGWQILNYISFEKKMRESVDEKVGKAKKEIEKDYIRGLTTTNLLLIPQYALLKNNRFIFVILFTTYKDLLKIEDYESADDVSMSVLEYFSFDCIKIDADNVQQLILLLEKISPHSNQTELLLNKLKNKCGLNNSYNRDS